MFKGSMPALVTPFGYALYEKTRYDGQQKHEGAIWPTYADTMVGRVLSALKRLLPS